MDVLTIQWGWIGGYPRTTPPAPVPTPLGGGAALGRPRIIYVELPPEDDGMVITLLGLLEDDY